MKVLIPEVSVVLIGCVMLTHGQEPQTGSRVAAALAGGEELAGLKIVANETTLVFNDNDPVAGVLKANRNLDRETRKRLGALANTVGGVTTNVCRRTYEFQHDQVLVGMEGVRVGNGLTSERALVTSNAVFEWRCFQAADNVTNITRFGEACMRIGNGPIGWPRFLSKRGLAEWISNTPNVSCERVETSQAKSSYVLTLPPPTDGPVKHYLLRIRADDLDPVELSSYSGDGSLYSTSELEFQSGEHPSICKRARTRLFSGRAVFMDSVWEVIQIEKAKSPVIESVDSFFPEGTRISDRRFAKPIAYRQGTRPPTDSEVLAMLENPRAVADYEAATHSKSQLTKLNAAYARHKAETKIRTKTIRTVFCAVSVLPLVLAVLVWHKRRKANRV